MSADEPARIRPRRFRDSRGFFQETFRRSDLERLGIEHEWVQENHSRSVRGVVRGLHFQVGAGQAKLVRCARGAIYDVTVDLRKGSPAFGRWQAHTLDDDSGELLYVPIGFANGFCVTSEVADVIYSCSSYYEPELERAVAYDDPEIAVEWPHLEHVVSERDAQAPRLAEIAGELPFTYAELSARR